MSAIETLEPVARTAIATPLAMKPRAWLAAEHARERLTFRLGCEEYGIGILTVQEIRCYEEKGVVDLRGVIVPILDLRIKHGLEHANYDSMMVTVILNVGARELEAVVDSVSDVVDLGAEQVKPALEIDGSVNAGFIAGIGVLEHGDVRRMLILVDIEQLMSSAAMALVHAAVH